MAARLLVVGLAFLIATDEFAAAVAWRAAALRADHAERDLRHADLQQLDVALAIAGDHFVVTALAPPIPSDIYERHHGELGEAWDAHAKALDAAASDLAMERR